MLAGAVASDAPISPWLGAHLERSAPLRDDVEADAAVIGASGRNAGHLTPTIGKDLPTLRRLFGPERVHGLLHLVDTAIGHVDALIDKYDLDCAYERVGNVCVAVHPRQHARIDRAAETARACGVPGELLDAAEMHRRGLPRAFSRGFSLPHGGHLDPGRYVRELRRAVLEAGAHLYEDTPVLRIDDASPVLVHAAGGRVRARHVVIATNAWTPQLGVLRSAGLRIHVQLFRTEPLTDVQLAAVGWPGREGLYTAHEALESYRLTADGRIVGGSKHVRYGFGGRPLPDVDPGVAARLEHAFRIRFPELGEVAIADHWGGPTCFGLDFLPAVGRAGRHRNLLYSVGYAGHGLALASYAGEMVADLLFERAGAGAALWSRRRLPLPPEPLRWLTFRALRGWFGAVDRRVDRRIERGEGGRR